jgi:1-aminocyclopropane-1-carboxylate deaminase
MKNLESLFQLWLPSPMQPFKTAASEAAGLSLWVKRDDLIHHHLSGNKYRKLKQHFKAFQEGDYREIVAFGGAFSNLLYSLSFIARASGIAMTFYIRGDGFDVQNPSLAIMQKNGVRMRFLDRATYREKNKRPVLDQILRDHQKAYVVPEGGSDPLAVPGSAEIVSEIESFLGASPDYLLMDLGTGGTFGGAMKAKNKKTRLLGIPVLKGVDWPGTLSPILEKELSQELEEGVEILDSYHFGGFAKYNEQLIQFINDFTHQYGIPLDPIYTGKLAFGVMDLLEKGYFEKGSTVVWVHSGGLQGIAGFNYLNGKKIF